jgi:eukaryotic-like serine/threonine-protein kinase
VKDTGTLLPARIGRYEIVGLLGRGAMGTVYRGRDSSLERDVAVKVMALGQADEDGRGRFLREGKAAARLQHPNIVTIYELGEHEGQLFMALELLEGLDLQHAISAGMRPDPRFTLPIVLHLLAGLGHAHEHGIVHRDVKPSNLFLPRGRPAKIMDFGVARLAGGQTATGVVIGTPNYMSPEQVRAAALDGRSDLFSTGLILYELVTGEKAYNADSVVSLLFKIVHEEPDFRAIPKGASWERLGQVLRRSLAKEPGKRYADAHAMAADLERALQDLGGSYSATAGVDQALLRGSTPHPGPSPSFVLAPAAAEPAAVAQGAREIALAPATAAATGAGLRGPLLLGGGLGALGVLAVATAGYLLSGRGTTRPRDEPRPPSVAPPKLEPAAAAARAPTPGAERRPSSPPPSPSPKTSAHPDPAPPPAEARLERANDHMEKGRYAQALAEAKAVLARDPENADAKALAGDAEAALVIESCVRKARAALDAGDRETALEEAKKGLAVNPSEARLLGLFREATQ